MPILTSVIAGELEPIRKGGVTFYPASELARIFDWAQQNRQTINRVEGLFYRPETKEGGLSVGNIGDRYGRPEAAFRELCLELANSLETEAASMGMRGYFEIVLAGD